MEQGSPNIVTAVCEATKERRQNLQVREEFVLFRLVFNCFTGLL